MPTFPSKPLNASAGIFGSFSHRVKRNPLLYFGLPFIVTMVGASFGLSQLTKTRYEVRDRTVKAVAKEEALGMSRNRRKLNLQEEYWRMQQTVDDVNWEQRRIQRPPSVQE